MTKTILVLAANPNDTPPLRLNQEIREIDNGLERAQKRSEFDFKPKLAARPIDVRRAMLDYKPTIVHFCGHGLGEEGIAFEDESGQSKIISTDALSGFFELFADQVECVILNACYSEVQAEAIAVHIKYVVGMKKAIGDESAIEFAVAFYDALGAGKSYDFAYKLACNAIQWAGLPEHLTPTLKKRPELVNKGADQDPIRVKSYSQSWAYNNIKSERYYPLPSHERILAHLMEILRYPGRSMGITIYGLGGLGKIALAAELARRALDEGLYEGLIRECTKHEILANGEVVWINDTTLSLEGFLDSIAMQIGCNDILRLELQEKQMALRKVFREHRYLIMLDNLHLQTDENIHRFIANIESFIGTGFVIITSRRNFNDYGNYCNVELDPLDLNETIQFLRTDAEQRSIQQILDAPTEVLEKIYQATSGIPLALKLVVNQAKFLDLNLITEQLNDVEGGVHDLYTVILRQSWEQLFPRSKEVLMYVAQHPTSAVTWKELYEAKISDNENELIKAIDQLSNYSLIEISSSQGHMLYSIDSFIHRFLISELPHRWDQETG